MDAPSPTSWPSDSTSTGKDREQGARRPARGCPADGADAGSGDRTAPSRGLSRTVAIGLAWIVVLAAGCEPSTPRAGSPAAHAVGSPGLPLAEATRREIAAFCGDCHALPRADFFPRAAWPDEIQLGYDRYFESRRTDLKVPVMAAAVRFFQESAPASLELPTPPAATAGFAREFREQDRAAGTASGSASGSANRLSTPAAPAIAHVAKFPLFKDAPPVWVTCDMRDGAVRWRDALEPASESAQLIAQLRNPCRASLADWDGDGRQDLLVADLGSFDPADHDRGQVVLLRAAGDDRSSWTPIVLMEGLGRVADVRSADLDSDGDLDLIVAEFGWRKSGRLFWLENEGGEPLRPRLTVRELDPRAGAIDAIPVDFNRDGRIDIVTVMSQHYEEVIVHLNEGGGRFTPQVISPAHDPAFGSSGIELADLDGDGDLDILYSNGDTFDSKLVKPYHGVQWLENGGASPFVEHRLADLAGAYKAVTGDLDQDGDLDIVAGAFLPRQLLGNTDLRTLDSLVVLEQTKPGQFARHRLLTGDFAYASLALDDLDGDRFPEIILGVFQLRDEATPHPALRVLRNLPAGTP